MKSLLKKIINSKKKEVLLNKTRHPISELLKKVEKKDIFPRDFEKRIKTGRSINCIGELKIASPVKGNLNKNLNLSKTAKLYEAAGVKALSVLTDIHFRGKLSDLKKVKRAVSLPVLRKDFIVDEYQLFESYCACADAVLLIAKILDKRKLNKMIGLVHSLKMHSLVEIHDQDDLDKIDFSKVRIVGINNRNLNDFSVDIKTTEKLIAKIPKDKIIVSESGISTRADMLYLMRLGVKAALIGEGIVTADDIALKIRNLLGNH